MRQPFGLQPIHDEEKNKGDSVESREGSSCEDRKTVERRSRLQVMLQWESSGNGDSDK